MAIPALVEVLALLSSPSRSSFRSTHVDPASLPFPDPETFVAGGVSRERSDFWEEILSYSVDDEAARIRRWISEGVTVEEFLNPKGFQGVYQGRPYSSLLPPRHIPHPYTVAPAFTDFVISSFEEDVSSGARVLLSRDVTPPSDLLVVSGCVIEPTKPRKCDDCTFLNLWMMPPSFSMEGLQSLTYWTNSSSAAVIDLKSCFHNIRLHPSAYKYFGSWGPLRGGGFAWFWSTVLVFGWSPSPFVAQSLGVALTRFVRAWSIPALIWIDDVAIAPALTATCGPACSGRDVVSVWCLTTVLAGFYISLSKSLFVVSAVFRFLGFTVDLSARTFAIPMDKREVFLHMYVAFLGFVGASVLTVGRCPGSTFTERGCQGRDSHVDGFVSDNLPYVGLRRLTAWLCCTRTPVTTAGGSFVHDSTVCSSGDGGARFTGGMPFIIGGFIGLSVSHVCRIYASTSLLLVFNAVPERRSVLCSACQAANRVDYRFCCMCGISLLGNVSFPLPPVVSIPAWRLARRSAFDAWRSSISKTQHKLRALESFTSFLASLPLPVDLHACTPSHVVDYLISMDASGRTQFHSPACPHAGAAVAGQRRLDMCDVSSCPSPSTCPHRVSMDHILLSCPIRAAAGSVERSISLLKTALEDSEILSHRPALGWNPVDSPLVASYLAFIREGSQASLVTPVQALPVFPEKVAVAVAFWRRQAHAVGVSRKTVTSVGSIAGVERTPPLLHLCGVGFHGLRAGAVFLGCPLSSSSWVFPVITTSSALLTFLPRLRCFSGAFRGFALFGVYTNDTLQIVTIREVQGLVCQELLLFAEATIASSLVEVPSGFDSRRPVLGVLHRRVSSGSARPKPDGNEEHGHHRHPRACDKRGGGIGAEGRKGDKRSRGIRRDNEQWHGTQVEKEFDTGQQSGEPTRNQGVGGGEETKESGMTGKTNNLTVSRMERSLES
ncbi:hypothetical protein BC829DRAFT_447705 [Chytridium lagenaria]|nr:hypothetical protein BC829DRAFT_447705 [Chytridium lagenaria]